MCFHMLVCVSGVGRFSAIDVIFVSHGPYRWTEPCATPSDSPMDRNNYRIKVILGARLTGDGNGGGANRFTSSLHRFFLV